MEIYKRNELTILKPAQGKYLANKDKTEVYDGYIYLGKNDSRNNYVEVSEEEKNEIISKEQEKIEKEEEQR